MYQIQFDKPVRIHFIGIGGISMSGLAEILLEEGFFVSGSDRIKSELTEMLEKKGARIFIGQRASNIPENTDVVVYTAAIHKDNEEYLESVRRNLPMLTRAQLLGELMRNYSKAAAVAGTHGKTTTTSMIAEILLADGADPTISVGGMLDSIGGNIRLGKSGLFVTEACEYTNSFLDFYPTVEAVLNIDADHLDFFHDLEDIRRSFRLFMERLPKEGLLIINGNIPGLEKLTEGLGCRIEIYGTPKAPIRAENVSYDKEGRASFRLILPGKSPFLVRLGVPGEHNVENAMAAAGVALCLGASPEGIAKGLEAFRGTHRRFEKKGCIGGVTILDDYAHHPTEIKATLKAAANYPHRKIWCVFQPHTYSRTRALFSDFVEALSMADEVVLADIYAARETDDLGVSSALLARSLKERGVSAHYFPSFDEIETFLLENCMNGDLLITMGAGDVVKIGENLLGK